MINLSEGRLVADWWNWGVIEYALERIEFDVFVFVSVLVNER